MKRTLIAMTSMMAIGPILAACAGPEAANKVVLPLDHGPLAQTTPWANQQRLLRAEQEAREKTETQSTSRPTITK